MRWTVYTLVCAALACTPATAMEVLNQWRAPEDVWFARIELPSIGV